MTTGVLYLPHVAALLSTQRVTVYWSDGTNEDAESLADLKSTHGTFKLEHGGLTRDQLPKDRSETIYSFTGSSSIGVVAIALTHHQKAVRHVVRGIRELATTATLGELIANHNQLLKNLHEAGLMSKINVVHLPIDGVDTSGDFETGAQVPIG